MRSSPPYGSPALGADLFHLEFIEFLSEPEGPIVRAMAKRLAGTSLSKVGGAGAGSRFIWTATLIGIAILLLALALLQYRWNAQIRQAAEVRAGADLESVMMKWHLDLYGEAFHDLYRSPGRSGFGCHDRWDDYLQRYERWRNAGSTSGENIYSNPDVVSDIYIWETTRRENAHLLRLNASAGTIEPVSKPRELNDLLSHLQKKSGSLTVALRAWVPDDSGQVKSKANHNRPLPASCGARRLRAGNSTRAFRP